MSWDPSPPPLEWVPAENRWWFYRWVAPLVVVTCAIVTLVTLSVLSPSPASLGWQLLRGLGVSMVVLVEYALVALFPSVRRLGISPLGIVVGGTLLDTSYSWSDVKQVTRTEVRRADWSSVRVEVRTRLRLKSGIFASEITLTPVQGERLARFLRLPSGERSGTLPSERALRS